MHQNDFTFITCLDIGGFTFSASMFFLLFPYLQNYQVNPVNATVITCLDNITRKKVSDSRSISLLTWWSKTPKNDKCKRNQTERYI